MLRPSKRTIDQRPDYRGFPKAGELIQITGIADLTLHDRRVFHELVVGAGSRICEDVEHHIPIAELRGNHESGDRVKDSIVALMRTLVIVPTEGRNGKAATKRTQLLADTTTTDEEGDPTGEVVYRFPHDLRKIIARSTHWGRVRSEIIFGFSSKYGLALYELLALRVGLEHKSSQVFNLAELRALLGVSDGKLLRNPDLLRYCISPAVLEVNGLSDIGCEVEPIRRGGTMRGLVSGFRVSWWRKTLPELHEAVRELQRPRVGRMARLIK